MFSDSRIKTNVVDRDSSKDLELLNRIPIQSFDYTDSIQHSNDIHIGVIAQDMEKLIPESVKHHPDIIPNYYKARNITEINATSFAIDGEFSETTGTKINFYYVKDGSEIQA